MFVLVTKHASALDPRQCQNPPWYQDVRAPEADSRRSYLLGDEDANAVDDRRISRPVMVAIGRADDRRDAQRVDHSPNQYQGRGDDPQSVDIWIAVPNAGPPGRVEDGE